MNGWLDQVRNNAISASVEVTVEANFFKREKNWSKANINCLKQKKIILLKQSQSTCTWTSLSELVEEVKV